MKGRLIDEIREERDAEWSGAISKLLLDLGYYTPNSCFNDSGALVPARPADVNKALRTVIPPTTPGSTGGAPDLAARVARLEKAAHPLNIHGHCCWHGSSCSEVNVVGK